MESIDRPPVGGWSEDELIDAQAGAVILRPSVRAGGLDGLISDASGEPTVVVRMNPPQSIDTKVPEVPKE